MHLTLARLVTPFVWRFPGNDARKLRSFASAELGSMLDLRLAAARTASPTRRALYLRHALDEARHARVFAQAADVLRKSRGLSPCGAVHADAEDLHERLGETLFLAFVHRGERRGRMQFEAYRDHFAARGESRMASIFEGILVDERRHEAYTRELLVTLAGSSGAESALRRAAAWEAWRAWRRAGRAIALCVWSVSVALLFATLLPIALFLRLKRAPRGFASAAR